MKLKTLPIILAIFALTGCNIIEFSKDSHEPGPVGSVESRQQTIAYFDGDHIEKGSLTAHELTFIVEEDEVSIDKKNPSALKDLIVDNDNIIQSIDKAEEISTFYSFEENANIGNGLKVGYTSDLVDGNLNFTFNCSVKAAEITGFIRYGIKGLEEGNVLVVDENAAISANGSRYVRLPYNKDVSALEQKTCSFNFLSDGNTLKINVYGKRAVITKIVVYS